MWSLTGSQVTQVSGRTAFLKVCLWGCFQKKLGWELVDRVNRLSSPVWVGLIHSTDSLNKTKKWRKGEFSLPSGSSGTSALPCLSWFSDLQTQTESTPSALWLRSYIGGIPGPAACWWQTVRLLSLNSSVSQYIKIILFLSY